MSKQNQSKAKGAALIVQTIDQTMAVLGENGLTDGQRDMMIVMLERMTNVSFLSWLVTALAMGREAEIKTWWRSENVPNASALLFGAHKVASPGRQRATDD